MRTCTAASRVFLTVAALQLLCASPGDVVAQDPARASALHAPAQLHDGWETCSPAECGLAAEPVAAMLQAIRSDSFPGIHSVLVAHGGRLAVEAYFPGYAWDYSAEGFRGARTEFGPDTRHNLASATKSVTGVLVGIAHDQGLLPDVKASAFSFFPEYARYSDKGKSGITLQHLLLMASGLTWNEQEVFYNQPNNDIVQLFIVPDPIGYVLSKEPAHPPASNWYYNGGGTILMGEIVHRVSGKALDRFAEQHLFAPLQISGAQWKSIRPGLVDASGGMELRPRDMAKLGQLVLDRGAWHGQRIVSEDWVKEMTSRLVRFDATRGYGYCWWTRTYASGPDSVSAVYADGWGGQRIMVFPTLDLVVVFTGGNYTVARPPRLDELVARFIIPAARGRTS